jgi:hypothetical protein
MTTVSIISSQNVIVSSAHPPFNYKFKSGQAVEVEEAHLEKLPGWGSENCSFRTVTGVKPKKKEEKKKEIKEDDLDGNTNIG